MKTLKHFLEWGFLYSILAAVWYISEVLMYGESVYSMADSIFCAYTTYMIVKEKGRREKKMPDCKICMKAIQALKGHTLHGYWCEREGRDKLVFEFKCSICGGGSDLKTNFCPNCGFPMDGDKSEID